MPFFRKDFFKDIEDLFGGEEAWGFFSPVVRSGPAINVMDDKNNIIVEVELPDIDPKNVDIEVEDNVLTVSGEEKDEKEEKNKNYYRKEMRRGSFKRTIRLPVSVKGDQAEADYEKGVLRITLPKIEGAKAKKIEIRDKS